MKNRNEVESRWSSPTVVAMRFGHTAGLSKLTEEARRLADLADRARTVARANIDVHFRAAADKTLTDGAALLRSARHAKAGLEGLTSALDRALTEAEEQSKVLRARLDAAKEPPNHVGKALVEAELRGRIAALDAEERAAAIRSDPLVLRAVASAPALLSGLSAELHGNLVREYLEQAAPDDLAQADDLAAAAKAAAQAVEEARAEARTFIDFQSAELIEKTATTGVVA